MMDFLRVFFRAQKSPLFVILFLGMVFSRRLPKNLGAKAQQSLSVERLVYVPIQYICWRQRKLSNFKWLPKFLYLDDRSIHYPSYRFPFILWGWGYDQATSNCIHRQSQKRGLDGPRYQEWRQGKGCRVSPVITIVLPLFTTRVINGGAFRRSSLPQSSTPPRTTPPPPHPPPPHSRPPTTPSHSPILRLRLSVCSLDLTKIVSLSTVCSNEIVRHLRFIALSKR